jgi:hypothetical protein
MKLNFVEKALMNSRARAFVQQRYEAPLLERLGECVAGAGNFASDGSFLETSDRFSLEFNISPCL